MKHAFQAAALCLLLAPLAQAQPPAPAPAQSPAQAPTEPPPQFQVPAPAEDFIVSDIRVEGLQRISAGSVFTAIPVAVGDVATPELLRESARSLFATGNFDDISLERDGNVLVITVEERPSISEITIEGNEAIETEALLEGLKGAGLAEGQVFQRATLEGMQLELQRQYVQQGRYDAVIEAEVIPEPRNRVAINIEVNEGTVAAISHVNIVGNSVFSDEELMDLFELKSTNWLSWIRSDDKYSREKLTGDLEALSSHYLDKGYLLFNIDSTQVAVSPRKDAVFITINITEGGIYTVSSVGLSGELVLPEEDLGRFLIVRQGQIYSQALVTATEEYLTQRLGNEGYNFAKVTGIPEVDEENKTVEMKFFIEPGKRTYVRRISFRGNTRTRDEVLRREMRQMEGAPASNQAIEASRVRLERLGFFKEAKVETPEVPGHDDLIDVEFEVEEQTSGSIGASLGYAQSVGAIFGLNLQQDNFLGSGSRIGIGANASKYQDYYNFSYTNPYYTEDGVSRGLSFFYRATDLDEINVARYSTDTIGASVNFGYPIRETERIGFSIGVSDTGIAVGDFAVQEISRPQLNPNIKTWRQRRAPAEEGEMPTFSDPMPIYDADGNFTPEFDAALQDEGFIDTHGDQYLNWTLTTSWSQSTLNRGIFATAGFAQALAVEVSMPLSDLEFYKLTYRGEYYVPLGREWVLRFRTELGYGDGFGDTHELPFYEHFFAGGFGSVRGFETNTLGPQTTPAASNCHVDNTENTETSPMVYRCAHETDPIYEGEGDDRVLVGSMPRSYGEEPRSYVVGENGRLLTALNSADDPDPFGGNALIEGGIELIFPLPFVEDQRSLRSAFFFDVGNVFNTNCRETQPACLDVDAGELRYSAGIGVSWITGFGPLTFSLAKPFNAGEHDEEESFQFTIGRGF